MKNIWEVTQQRCDFNTLTKTRQIWDNVNKNVHNKGDIGPKTKEYVINM